MASHHSVIDYFPETAHPEVFCSLFNFLCYSDQLDKSFIIVMVLNDSHYDNKCIVFFLCSQGIVTRDEIVFRAAQRRGIPILMVTSGGYQKKTARIIADSILNLHRQHLIGGEVLDEAGQSVVPVMMSKSVSAGAIINAI